MQQAQPLAVLAMSLEPRRRGPLGGLAGAAGAGAAGTEQQPVRLVQALSLGDDGCGHRCRACMAGAPSDSRRASAPGPGRSHRYSPSGRS